MKMPDRRYGHASVVADGRLWVIGGTVVTVTEEQPQQPRGDDNSNSSSTTVAREVHTVSDRTYCYDFCSMRWMPGPTLGQARAWHHAFCIDGSVYVVGGNADKRGKALHPTIEKLHLAALSPSPPPSSSSSSSPLHSGVVLASLRPLSQWAGTRPVLVLLTSTPKSA